MKKAGRSRIAFFLTVIYLLITVSPLAPIALNSSLVFHAATGQCAGDCSICGCAPERSASHTCCCWQKKSTEVSSEEPQEVSECCKKKKRSVKPVARCTSLPCGSKAIAFWSGESFEYLLCCNLTEPFVPHEDRSFPVCDFRLTGRNAEPPVPPPKPRILS